MRRDQREMQRASGRRRSPASLAVVFAMVLDLWSSPVVAQICVGDCDRDGQVTMAELVTSVNVALGRSSPAVCEGLDEGSGRVRVGTLVRAVLNAMNGCRDARLIRTQILASSLSASLANLFYLTFEAPVPLVSSLTCDNGAIATFECNVVEEVREIEIELQRCGGGYSPEISAASEDQVTGTLTWITPDVGCADMASILDPITITFSGIVERPGSESIFSLSDVILEMQYDGVSAFDTSVSGLVDSPCLGGSRMISGSMDIDFNPRCPQSGALALMPAEAPFAPVDSAIFAPTGVAIDLDTDGELEAEFATCDAPSIAVCPGF